MREIKFRAWQDDKMMYSDGCGVYNTKRFLDKLYEDCNLMQFTGLKDKNGKEIYEGDIVKGSSNNHIHNAAEIVFMYGCFCATMDGGIGFMLDRFNGVEVIGNIYENPELLEVK